MRVSLRCSRARAARSFTGRPLRQRVSNGCRVHAFFKFGKNGADAKEAGMFAGRGRDDFDRIEMEHYFNYTGRLAVEQTYDTFNKYVEMGVHPVDVLLLWAAEEGDTPKVEELLEAGADATVKDLQGKTALQLAANDEVKGLIEASLAKA